MVVAYDATGPAGGAGTSGTGTTLTWSHICGSSASLLLVGVAVGASSDTSATTTATYNGVAMTSLGKIHSNNQAAGYVEAFALADPAVGDHSVVITRAGGSGTVTLSAGSVSYSGSSGVANVKTNAGSAATVTTTAITSAVDNMVAAFFVAGNPLGTLTGATRRVLKSTNNDSAGGNFECGDAPGATTVTVTTTDNGDWWAAIGVDIVAGSTPPTPHDAQVTGSYSWVGHAEAARPSVAPHNAQASGSYAWTGSATGARPMVSQHEAQASGAFAWAVSASASQPGIEQHEAQASGSYAWLGAATAHASHAAVAGGTYSWTSSATADKPPVQIHEAHASGTYSWSGHAVAHQPGLAAHEAQASGSYQWTGAAAARTTRSAIATGAYRWTGSALAEVVHDAQVSGTYRWVGHAATLQPGTGNRHHAVTFDERVRSVTFAERLRTVTFAERVRVARYEGDPMRLDRAEVDYYDPNPSVVPPLDGEWQASFDNQETWVDAQPGDRPTWLVAGPEADPSEADAVIPHTTNVWLRLAAGEVVIVELAPRIALN